MAKGKLIKETNQCGKALNYLIIVVLVGQAAILAYLVFAM